ncbi:MAG: TonB family protein [Planctomycetota bacterium]
MSSPTVLGGPLPLERRGTPAIAGAVSLALHGALFLVAFSGWGGRRVRPPVLAAAESELALSIARPAPPRAQADKTPEEVAEAPRPVARTEALRRIAAPRPEATDAPPPPRRISRARAPAAVAPLRVEDVPRASYESAGGIRAPVRLGDARPHYPPACQGARHRTGGCEGAGRYAIDVDVTGRVLSAKTERSAGCRHLDAAAVRFLLRRARFEAATVDGVPVPWEGLMVIRFDLEERGARPSGPDASRSERGMDR